MARDELLRSCVGVAVLAPSKHNTQPWRFQLGDDVVDLYADRSRGTPVSDPTGRELVIGCGAALYTLRLAIRSAGREALTIVFPEGEDADLLARVTVGPPAAVSDDDAALLAAVPRRHTDRGRLDASTLSPALPFLLQRAAEREGATLQLLMAPGVQDTLEELVARADRAVSTDPKFREELREWAKDGADDGVPLAARGPGAARAYRRHFVQRDFDATGEAVPGTNGVTDAPLPAVLWTDGDRPYDWLRAGQALQAVLLRATVAGASAGFLNQPLEVPALRAELRHELALPGFPQLVLRLGAGHGGVPTPRRPVDVVTSRRGG